MSPGDSCYSFRDGTQSYEEAARNAVSAPLWLGLLALAFLGGGIHHWRKDGNRSRRSPGPTAPPPGGTSAGSALDTIPLVRTPAEAHLAMSLSPCSCGVSEVVTQGALFVIDGTFVWRYSTTCRCGEPREFLFRLPDDPLVSPPGEFRFGDGSPSQLLDPGVWLAVADHYARSAPADVSGLDAAAQRPARHDVLRAAAAMDEVIAFIPPGASAVPPTAFSSPAGRRVRDREPGRFHRNRLEVVRDTYRQVLAEMANPRQVS